MDVFQDAKEENYVAIMDEDEATKLIRLIEKYGRKYKCNQEISDNVWNDISSEGFSGLDPGIIKKKYYELYNKYKKMKYQSKLSSCSLDENKDWNILQRFEGFFKEEPLCDLTFVVDNFDRICRFCLDTSNETTNLQPIYDDSTDESTADSYDFLEMVDFVLNDNGSNLIDCKLSNLVCKNCFDQINNLHRFKKKCEKSAKLLQDAKIELELKISCYEVMDQANAQIEAVPVMKNIVYVETNSTNDQTNNEEEIKENDEETFSDINELDEKNENIYENQSKLGSNAELSELSDDESSESDKKYKLKSKEELEDCEGLKHSCSGSERDDTTPDALTKVAKKKRSKKPKVEKLCEKGERARSQCSICGRLYVELSAHMRIHTNDKKYRCHLCDKGFCQSGQLTRHINSHLDIRKYSCKICSKTFVDPSSLPKHMVVHNKDNKKFVCRICGATFPRMASWKHHERSHRQEKNFSCDICSKTFAFKQYLKKHYVLHSGVLPHSCPYCSKKFASSKNINVHIRTHTKETPYTCPICSSAYSYRSTLKSHMAKVHNQVPSPNASLLRQHPDDKISQDKQQNSNLLVENVSGNNTQEESKNKNPPQENLTSLAIARTQINYSLQKNTSGQDEIVIGDHNNRIDLSYANTTNLQEEQNMGPRDIRNIPRDILMNF